MGLSRAIAGCVMRMCLFWICRFAFCTTNLLIYIHKVVWAATEGAEEKKFFTEKVIEANVLLFSILKVANIPTKKRKKANIDAVTRIHLCQLFFSHVLAM